MSMRVHFQRLSTKDNWTICSYSLLLTLLDYFPGGALAISGSSERYVFDRRGECNTKSVILSRTLLPSR